jgi:hypothetical protein
MSTRSFNHVETGMVLNRLTNHVPRHMILDTYMPLLNLPSYESMLDVFLRLENLDDPIKIALAEGCLSMQTIQSLLEMDKTSRLSVFEYLIKLNFNFNKQRQFIDMILDLSVKEKVSVSSILHDESLLHMMERDEHNKPQKVKQIFRWLKHRRFPQLTRVEETLKKRINFLNLPKGVEIDPPPFFEKEEFLMYIAFKNGSTLRNTLVDLNRIKGLETLIVPWEADK